jgi:hypothetical protein
LNRVVLLFIREAICHYPETTRGVVEQVYDILERLGSTHFEEDPDDARGKLHALFKDDVLVTIDWFAKLFEFNRPNLLALIVDELPHHEFPIGASTAASIVPDQFPSEILFHPESIDIVIGTLVDIINERDVGDTLDNPHYAGLLRSVCGTVLGASHGSCAV